MPKQEWNAESYAREGRFVSAHAGEVMRLLAPQPGERILDLGCGDGMLTAQLAALGAEVVGVDSSAAMVEAARARGLDARLVPMERLTFAEEFDAVFSNAALHWVRDQDAMLKGVFCALRPGGRFVAEMGGHGNIAALRTALRSALLWEPLGERTDSKPLHAEEELENYFPTAQAYQARLMTHGFQVAYAELHARPTPLGESGVRGWYQTFRTGVLLSLSEPRCEAVLAHAERLLEPVLRDETGIWIADYVRLRFLALKPE